MALRQSLVVRCAPQALFGWIEDPARASQWQVGVIGYEVTHAEPGVVGTRFRETIGDAQGSVELRGEVVEYEPGRVIAFRVEGRGLRVASRYEVSPDPTGARLDVLADVRVGGPLSFLLAPLTRRRSARLLRTELDRLRSCCER